MKLCIMCQSTLLQKALEYYLAEFLTSYKDCEFVLCDTHLNINKPICLLNNSNASHIKKPFTPVSLFKDLQDFYHTKIKKHLQLSSNIIPKELLHIQDPKLQTKIDHILQEFSQRIYQTLHHDEK